FALIDLSRRQQVLHARKWVWVIIIIGGQIIGPIVYLAWGRKVDEVTDRSDTAGDVRERSRKALDVLYEREDPE
ncbi:MAG: PLDc N-terminal domain-containing protein, partial [Planctomycetota bacterium]